MAGILTGTAIARLTKLHNEMSGWLDVLLVSSEKSKSVRRSNMAGALTARLTPSARP